MSESRLGALEVALAAISWSFAGALSKTLPWNSLTINGMRSLVAAVLLGLARGGVKVRITRGTLLGALGTANLILSTVSVTTSFLAAYLTFRRSPFYALAYAANDVVLILLWLLMARKDPSAISVLACFAAFLANDLYGYVSWRRMARRQYT